MFHLYILVLKSDNVSLKPLQKLRDVSAHKEALKCE